MGEFKGLVFQEGETMPLMLAAKWGRDECVSALVASGAEVNTTDEVI